LMIGKKIINLGMLMIEKKNINLGSLYKT